MKKTMSLLQQQQKKQLNYQLNLLEYKRIELWKQIKWFTNGTEQIV